jgi:predicted HicB family RNase H-like nuclease
MGLEFSRSTSFDSWLRLGSQLSAVSTSSAWCLGDWLLYGIANYEGRYREAIEQTSLDYQTLRNYAWVANRFSKSRRRGKLSFGHHTEVAALPTPEQDFWLRKAEELGWPVKRLRQEVRSSIKERSSHDHGQPEHPLDGGQSELPLVKLQVDLSPEQLEVCRVAASSAGLSIAEWVARTLEDAARRVVLDQLTNSHTMPVI